MTSTPVTQETSRPVALSIAGSDSGGGAGIQADLGVFHCFGVFGTTAITAITAQNTRGVMAWQPVEPALVRAQIDAVASDLPPRAVKSGMLPTAGIVETVAHALVAHHLGPYVLDPVMVATTGVPLIAPDAVIVMRRHLLPLADLVTPNLDEIEALTGERVRDIDAMARAARALIARYGARAVLVKGGHLAPDQSGDGFLSDVLVSGDDLRVFRHCRLASRHTHGTGCTLSAAITAGLASGATLGDAVATAIQFVERAIARAPGLGAGHGPLDHWA